jgi:thiol-disulfide isomerase/thioredoxin
MQTNVTSLFRRIHQDPFKRYLVTALVVLGAVLLFTREEAAKPATSERFEVHFFYLPGCSHCHEQEPLNDKLANEYPSMHFIYHDAMKAAESALLAEMLASAGEKATQRSL